MAESPVYSIILPTYCEKDNLPLIIWLLINSLKGKVNFEILVVDDNSPDGTADVYAKLQEAYSDVKLLLLRRAGKLGLGSAYMDGMKKISGDYVILMDADMSHHPKFILDFIKLQQKHDLDVVTGTRYAHGGGVFGWDLRRVFISRVANHIAQTLLNPGVSDLTGSFRLFKRSVIEAIMPKMLSRGYVFQMEIICRAQSMGCKIGEVPITFVDRIFGESKLGGQEIVGYLGGLMKLFWNGTD